MPSVTGIIGGSGFYTMSGETQSVVSTVQTPFSECPVLIYRSMVGECPVVFLPRHGSEHGIPPHRVNYRANLWAIQQSGATAILAVNVVGGIRESLDPGILLVPDQIIDYTSNRDHTFFDVLDGVDNHIDFTWPYNENLRKALLAASDELGLACNDGGVYGCTQGPRLETAAEIRRMQADGCDIVGMTGMPEAALARELGIAYACIALVVNRAAGLREDVISFADIATTLDRGIETIRRLLQAALPKLP